MLKNIPIAAGIAVLLGAPPLAAKSFRIDPASSRVAFRINHFGGEVLGRFDSFKGSFDYVPGRPRRWSARADIRTASIDTELPARDRDLRSKSFFAADRCPLITFRSRGSGILRGGKAFLRGTLGIHCVERPVTLELRLKPLGRGRFEADAETVINRLDFGMTWNKTLDRGGLLIGRRVRISIRAVGMAQDGPDEKDSSPRAPGAARP